MERFRRSALASFVVLAASCATPASELQPAPATTAVAVRAGAAASPPRASVSDAPLADAPAAQAAELVVTLGSGFGELRVANRGAPMKLLSSVGVEMQRDGEWVTLPVGNLFLRASCERKDVPDCVGLGTGASLDVVPWTGRLCSSQCLTPCRLDGAEEPGIYRFVVKDCAGSVAHVSAAFEGTGRGSLGVVK